MRRSPLPWMASTGRLHATEDAFGLRLIRRSTAARPRRAARLAPPASMAQPTQSSRCLVECGSCSSSLKNSSEKPYQSCCQYCQCSLVQSESVYSVSAKPAGILAGGAGRCGSQAEMLTTPSTRSGCRAAVSSKYQAPLHRPTSTACATPAASMTAMVSATNSASEYAAGTSGRSDRPLPRGCDADDHRSPRKGTVSVPSRRGSSRSGRSRARHLTAGSPWPNDFVADLDAVASRCMPGSPNMWPARLLLVEVELARSLSYSVPRRCSAIAMPVQQPSAGWQRPKEERTLEGFSMAIDDRQTPDSCTDSSAT